MTGLIKMRRNEPQHEGGPTTADVHPNEVAEYQRADWQIAEQPEPSLAPEQQSKRKSKRQPQAEQPEPLVE